MPFEINDKALGAFQSTDSIYFQQGDLPGNTSYRGKIGDIASLTIVPVYSDADFPAPTDTGDGFGTAIHLENGKNYRLNATTLLFDPIVVDPGVECMISSEGSLLNPLVYIGAVPLFNSTDFGRFLIFDIILADGAGLGGNLFNMAATSAPNLILQNCIIAWFVGDFGTIDGIRFNFDFGIASGFDDGGVFTNCGVVAMGDAEFSFFNDVGGTFQTYGLNNAAIINRGMGYIGGSSETLFDFQDPNSFVTVRGASKEGVATIFAPGSEDHRSINYNFFNNLAIPNSTVSGEFEQGTAVTAAPVTTTVTIPAQFAYVIPDINTWTSDEEQRLSLDADGVIEYTGLNDQVISINGYYIMEPVTGNNIRLGTQFLKLGIEGVSVTFDNTTNVVNEVGHSLNNGDIICFYNTSGTLPAALSRHYIYYVVNTTVNTFQLSYTSGGAAVAFADNGTPPNSYDLISIHGQTLVSRVTAGASESVPGRALMDIKTGEKILFTIINLDNAADIDLTATHKDVSLV